MASLQMQNILYEEAKAKGWVRELWWYTVEFLSSDFILAALILCLELQFERDGEANVSKTAETIDTDADRRQESVLGVLRRARSIWKDVQEYSAEAWKVFRVLTTILEACEAVLSEKMRTDSVASDEKQTVDNIPTLIPGPGQTSASQDVPIDMVGFD